MDMDNHTHQIRLTGTEDEILSVLEFSHMGGLQDSNLELFDRLSENSGEISELDRKIAYAQDNGYKMYYLSEDGELVEM